MYGLSLLSYVLYGAYVLFMLFVFFNYTGVLHTQFPYQKMFMLFSTTMMGAISGARTPYREPDFTHGF